MKEKFISNIEPAMQILEKHFHYTERTTLNRMRKEKKSPKNAFKILISCLLSLRAKDETTNRISKQLFLVADTPQQIAKMNTKKLEKIIFSSGHYHKKARTLKHVSKELIKRFNSKVPNNKEDLMSIKGIGPKTSNIVLNFAFNQQFIPVDTHCHRIPNRLGWVKTKTAEKTEKELEKILPKKYWMEFNGIFVLFGKTICLPISPKCSICPTRDYCPRIGVIKSR
ncbi:MAG: endonuclease III [Candidatus Nanoarchaeia archaeon]|nr:endonuclease III [Candidatus Nanoarchaeia archaeon]MDD5740442.1 endonuclease III [Candidatus Nanoarchaeia archaeon]